MDAVSASAAVDWTVALAVPAVRSLLRPSPEHDVALIAVMQRLAEYPGQPRMRDLAGQTRPEYHPLVAHLCLRAFAQRNESLTEKQWSAGAATVPGILQPLRAAEALAPHAPPAERTALTLWEALCLLQGYRILAQATPRTILEALVDRITSQPGPGGSLHPQNPDESLDAWTWRELTGLHALTSLTGERQNPRWARRVEEVAKFHLENTQPDNTTTQPWGLPAFLTCPDTRSLGEQQLHDLQTYNAVHRRVPLVTALLLADASLELSRRER